MLSFKGEGKDQLHSWGCRVHMYLRDPIIVGMLMDQTHSRLMNFPFMDVLMGKEYGLPQCKYICEVYFLCRFSRKIIRLEVAKTNNNSSVIAGYFLKAVANYGRWCLTLYLWINYSYPCRVSQDCLLQQRHRKQQHCFSTTVFEEKFSWFLSCSWKLPIWQVCQQSS